MDIIRRNTDYALRAMINLAGNYGKKLVSSRSISLEEHIPYQLTCKLMQKLHKAKFITSTMGPKGGFELSSKPEEISILEIIETIQEPLSLNKCILSNFKCPKKKQCPIRPKLEELQTYIGGYLKNLTLADIIEKPKQEEKDNNKKGKA